MAEIQAILSNNLYIPKTSISNIENLRHKLTIESKYKDKEKVHTFTETAKYIGIPRYYNHGLDVDIEDRRSLGARSELECITPPRDYQVPLLEEMQDSFFNQGRESCILNSETGSGKSYMAINMLCKFKTTTLIIVPKIDLMEQWKKALLEFTTINEHEIGFVQGENCNYQGKKVMIGMVHTLCKDKFDKDFKTYFGLVIYDEIHRCGAITFSKTCGMFSAKYRLGVSATVARQDGMDMVFRLHLGRNEIKLRNNEQPIPKVLIFKYGQSSGQTPKYCANQATFKRAALLNLLASNKDRCEKICNLAIQLQEGRQVVILSERKKMIDTMKKILVGKYMQPAYKIGVYIGETSQKEKERIAKECSIILASQQMLSEGSDIPTLRALILSTPVTTIIQPVGRIRRIKEGLKQPIVIDFVDSAYVECNRWHQKRLKEYKDMKCEIKTL